MTFGFARMFGSNIQPDTNGRFYPEPPDEVFVIQAGGKGLTI